MGVRGAVFRSGTKGRWGGGVSRSKVQMGWKRSLGLLGSAQIAGNQMEGSHPPPKLLSVIKLNLSLLCKADIRLKNEKLDILNPERGPIQTYGASLLMHYF